jgi:hypothetical protein
MEIAWLVARHQRDLAAGVDGQDRRLEGRSSVLERRHRELAARLERVEGGLTHVEQALPRRRLRIATLRALLSVLREGVEPQVRPTRPERLGTALIYAGCLVLVWLVLWQLGLAFGLR